MAVTARIGSEQGGDATTAYQWAIEYDDATRRITAQATGAGNITVTVQITQTGAPASVMFVQPGRPPDAGIDFPVTIGAGATVIGPAVQPGQVARIIGKPGVTVGGLPFAESWSRV